MQSACHLFLRSCMSDGSFLNLEEVILENQPVLLDQSCLQDCFPCNSFKQIPKLFLEPFTSRTEEKTTWAPVLLTVTPSAV